MKLKLSSQRKESFFLCAVVMLSVNARLQNQTHKQNDKNRDARCKGNDHVSEQPDIWGKVYQQKKEQQPRERGREGERGREEEKERERKAAAKAKRS
jgi:hypothetical protein